MTYQMLLPSLYNLESESFKKRGDIEVRKMMGIVFSYCLASGHQTMVSVITNNKQG